MLTDAYLLIRLYVQHLEAIMWKAGFRSLRKQKSEASVIQHKVLLRIFLARL